MVRSTSETVLACAPTLTQVTAVDSFFFCRTGFALLLKSVAFRWNSNEIHFKWIKMNLIKLLMLKFCPHPTELRLYDAKKLYIQWGKVWVMTPVHKKIFSAVNLNPNLDHPKSKFCLLSPLSMTRTDDWRGWLLVLDRLNAWGTSWKTWPTTLLLSRRTWTPLSDATSRKLHFWAQLWE